MKKVSWAYTVSTSKISHLSQDEILFTLYNKTQEVEFNKNREELVQFLREKLDNEFITIDTEMQEVEESAPKAFDPEERYGNMVKENPLLQKLKEKFDLDL